MNPDLTRQLLRALWVILIVLICLFSFLYITPLVYPFIIGWFIAFAMNPLVNLLNRWVRLPRWLASLISLLLFLGVFVAVITLLVSRIIVEISRFANYINQNIDSWIEKIVQILESDQFLAMIDQVSLFSAQNERLYETIENNLISAGERLSEQITRYITALVETVISLVTSLPNFALIIVVILLAAFFMSKDWYKLSARTASLFPKAIVARTRNIWIDLKRALFGYVRAQLIMISITAIFIIVGLLIMRVNHAITIGLLIGIVDLLPYLGVGAVMVPWAIILFIQGNISLGIGISVLYAIVLVVRSMIEPKVLATSIGLGALSTLISMVVGLKLFGIVGVVIGPVSVVLAVALFKAHVFQDIRNYILHGKDQFT